MRLLICGIPGTGKSTFARWLVSEHGFVRCPSGDEPGSGFGQEINAAFSRNPNVVIDWGFPAYEPGFGQSMNVVRDLISNWSVQHWWFDGDRSAALQSFLDRGNVPQAAWDLQLSGIEGRWDEISRAFDGRMIDVIAEGPKYLPPEELFALVSSDAN